MALSKIQFGNTGRRNMVINGAMQIAQRGTDIDDIATDGQKNLDMFSGMKKRNFERFRHFFGY